MPFSQQSYQGGGGESRQIFNRSGEILGSGLNRAFEILAASAGRKAEKDELRKRRTQFIQGQEKALKAILDEDLPDEYYDLPDDAKASYLDSYTTNVLPEIKAERERERLKEAWSSIAPQYGIDPNTPAEIIDDLIGFQQQTQFEKMRQENRIALEKMQAENAQNYLRDQNEGRLKTEQELINMRRKAEQEKPAAKDPRDAYQDMVNIGFEAQKYLGAQDLLDVLPPEKQNDQAIAVAGALQGKPGAFDNAVEIWDKMGLFDNKPTGYDWEEDDFGDESKKSSKSSRAPKDNRETVNVGELLNQRARGYTPYGSGPTY